MPCLHPQRHPRLSRKPPNQHLLQSPNQHPHLPLLRRPRPHLPLLPLLRMWPKKSPICWKVHAVALRMI
jgi:hypothetical protein